MNGYRRLGLLAMSLAVAGCGTHGTLPGMAPYAPRAHAEDPALVELSRAEPRDDMRALLVVYPRDACSGSASAVFVDEDLRFLGALGPGTAALLEVPRRASTVFAIPSIELTASRGTSSTLDRVDVPQEPDGIRLASWRPSGGAGGCGNGQYTDAFVASKEELEALLAENMVTWLAAQRGEGQAWLDSRRERLEEVVANHHAWRARVRLQRVLWGGTP